MHLDAGINLYGANRVVVFDASWNPSLDMQSIFRVYRFGQKKPCYIYRFLAHATMEEKIYRRQIVKLSLSHRVVDEQQVERHYTFDHINELYHYDPEEIIGRPPTRLPVDEMLRNLIASNCDLVESYFEHDSLLQDLPDEKLSAEQQNEAWSEYHSGKATVDNDSGNDVKGVDKKVKRDKSTFGDGYKSADSDESKESGSDSDSDEGFNRRYLHALGQLNMWTHLSQALRGRVRGGGRGRVVRTGPRTRGAAPAGARARSAGARGQARSRGARWSRDRFDWAREHPFDDI